MSLSLFLWRCSEQGHAGSGDTGSCRTGGTALMGGISRYTACLGDTKGKVWLECWKNSLCEDFRAVHRKVTSELLYHTACIINTINATCRWGNRPSKMTWFNKGESTETRSTSFISIVWRTVAVLGHPCSSQIIKLKLSACHFLATSLKLPVADLSEMSLCWWL